MVRDISSKCFSHVGTSLAETYELLWSLFLLPFFASVEKMGLSLISEASPLLIVLGPSLDYSEPLGIGFCSCLEFSGRCKRQKMKQTKASF